MNRDDLAYIQGRYRANPTMQQLAILAQECLCTPEDIAQLLGLELQFPPRRPRKKPTVLPLARRAELITDMARNGWTASQTAKEAGIQISTVWGWLGNVRAGRYDKVLSAEIRQKIFEMHKPRENEGKRRGAV